MGNLPLIFFHPIVEKIIYTKRDYIYYQRQPWSLGWLGGSPWPSELSDIMGAKPSNGLVPNSVYAGFLKETNGLSNQWAFFETLHGRNLFFLKNYRRKKFDFLPFLEVDRRELGDFLPHWSIPLLKKGLLTPSY